MIEPTLCSCGMPQSYPIPHNHDMTDRERQIYLHMQKQVSECVKQARAEVLKVDATHWEKMRVLIARLQIDYPKVSPLMQNDIEVLYGFCNARLREQTPPRSDDDISQCPSCKCMTHTVNGKCGKCAENKASAPSSPSPDEKCECDLCHKEKPVKGMHSTGSSYDDSISNTCQDCLNKINAIPDHVEESPSQDEKKEEQR